MMENESCHTNNHQRQPSLSSDDDIGFEDASSNASTTATAVTAEEQQNAESESESEEKTPLSAVVDAFEDLAKYVEPTRNNGEDERDNERGVQLRLVTLCDACCLVSVLFNCLGLAFKFAESEYAAKVRDLVEASKTIESLENVLDQDIENSSVRTSGSHSRNLRRVRQGLELIRALFEQFLSSNDASLKDAATTAYAQVCAPYHSWAVRTAVYAGMYALPSRDQLLLNLNETVQSAERKMRRYIDVSRPVIEYIDKLYISRNISLDW